MIRSCKRMGLMWHPSTRRLAGCIAGSVVALVCFMLAPASVARAQGAFPVSVDAAQLKGLGIVLHNSLEDTPLAVKCYRYGDGGSTMSISQDVVAHFAKRGFSVPALCMGLAANLRFHPETGRRLPTYVLRGQERNEKGRMTTVALSSELPLDLPDCLRNGRYYRDCTLNFDPFTGKRMSPSDRDRRRANGLEVEGHVTRAIGGGRFQRDCSCSDLAKVGDDKASSCRIDRSDVCIAKEISDTEAQLKSCKRSEGCEEAKVRQELAMLKSCRCSESVADNRQRCEPAQPPGCQRLIDNQDAYMNFEIEVLYGKPEDMGLDKATRPGTLRPLYAGRSALNHPERSYITLVDVMPSLSGGFGYGLALSGDAGGEPDEGAIRAAANPKRRATDSGLRTLVAWYRRR